MRETQFFKDKSFQTGDIVKFTHGSKKTHVEAVGLEVVPGPRGAMLVTLDSSADIDHWYEEAVFSFQVVQTAAQAIAANLKSRRYGPGNVRKPGLALFSKLGTRKHERTGKDRKEWAVLLSAYEGLVIAMNVEEDKKGEIIVGKAYDFARRSLTRTWAICTPLCPQKGKFGMHRGLCQEEVFGESLSLPPERPYDRELRYIRQAEQATDDYDRRFFDRRNQVSGCELMVRCTLPQWTAAVMPANSIALFAGSRVAKRFYSIAEEDGELHALLESGTMIENGCWLLPFPKDTLSRDFTKFVKLLFFEARGVFEAELRSVRAAKVSMRAHTALKVMAHLPISEIELDCNDWMDAVHLAELKAIDAQRTACNTVANKIEGKGTVPDFLRSLGLTFPSGRTARNQQVADAVEGFADLQLIDFQSTPGGEPQARQ